MARLSSLTLLTVSGWLTGCVAEPERAAVQGTVHVGDEVVETGIITFVPVGKNKGPSAGGPIENGRFDIPAKRGPVLGEQRVQIVGHKKTGRQVPVLGAPMEMMVDELVPIVPARFGTASSELAEYIEPGVNELTIEVPTQ